ncbi:hypothetical protein [Deinococcus alpinitundrae]|uniref:hypothetical protein n=1 Tax=Deinococcus alpinitundrae TaxID=468913 RepID=UPI00137B43BD|nr:hypothetical protein [Deinococcus alpinitundrae]
MTELPHPALTLAEIRALSLINTRHISAAREHVGAAGLEQTAALERMITVSREQVSMTQALELLGRTLRDDQPGETATQHLAMAELRLASEEQLAIAHQLENVIALALQNVTLTPLEQISVAALTKIGDQVKAQIKDLEALIKEAQANPSPAHQVALDRVEGQVQMARERSVQDEISGQLQLLGGIGEDAIEQIAQVEGASAQHQIEALERMAEKVHEQVEVIKQQS